MESVSLLLSLSLSLIRDEELPYVLGVSRVSVSSHNQLCLCFSLPILFHIIALSTHIPVRCGAALYAGPNKIGGFIAPLHISHYTVSSILSSFRLCMCLCMSLFPRYIHGTLVIWTSQLIVIDRHYPLIRTLPIQSPILTELEE